MKLAETGHLTMATLHTNSAAQTITRIIDAFPAHQQAQIRTQLSLVLEGIVCQALVPKLSGSGRVAALEILVATPAIRNLIRDDKIHQIYGTMQAGQVKLGMQTMNQSLARLVEKRLISRDTALNTSSLRDELITMLERGSSLMHPSMQTAAASNAPGAACRAGSRTWRQRHSRGWDAPAPDRSSREAAGRVARRAHHAAQTRADPRDEGAAGRAQGALPARALAQPRHLHAAVLGHDRRRPPLSSVSARRKSPTSGSPPRSTPFASI
jgi:hypothetical protein